MKNGSSRNSETSPNKNHHAVELAKIRSSALTPERRSEIGVIAARARALALTAKQRSLIARKAAESRWSKWRKERGL